MFTTMNLKGADWAIVSASAFARSLFLHIMKCTRFHNLVIVARWINLYSIGSRNLNFVMDNDTFYAATY